MSANPKLDPYTAHAENTNITPQRKIEDLKGIVKGAGTAMLTTRSQNGHLHSRAMTPANPKKGENELHFLFIGNNVSTKFHDIENDEHVNVSFYDHSSTNWASISGIAKVNQDKEKIKAHWSKTIAGYFGDLGDGVHKGNEDDPRISIIEVIPDEIRYWFATKGTVGRTVETAVSVVTGKAKAPGELRTISNAELQQFEGLHQK